MTGFPLDLNSPRIGLMRPRDDFDECRFACAVLPKQGVAASVQIKETPFNAWAA